MPTSGPDEERHDWIAGPANPFAGPADYFADAVAAGYDDAHAGAFEPAAVEPVVDLLEELAGGGRVLEFGVGTGRIALPLAARGVPVHGIDLSDAMLARLRQKEGAAGIGLTRGDIASTRVDGGFSLVFLVYNTIMNLTSQDAQVECFRNAAGHLEPGGRFLIEVLVPDLRRLPPGERGRVFDLDRDHVGIDEYSPATQGLVSHHIDLHDGTPRLRSIPFRYVWPSELDLMARIAGLELEHRWGGWRREPYVDESRFHVSVWRRPAAGDVPGSG
jgi:SAM-dependent methyltransferase